MEHTFTCIDCYKAKPVQTQGGTGYATAPQGKVCYECCATRDKAAMRADGKYTLYLSDGQVTNWPGTLRFPVRKLRKGRHNLARVRYDFEFIGPDGKLWTGYQIGDNTQIAHCRRVKRAA